MYHSKDYHESAKVMNKLRLLLLQMDNKKYALHIYIFIDLIIVKVMLI